MSDENPHSGNGSSQKGLLEKIGQLFQGEPRNIGELMAVIRQANQDQVIDADSHRMIEGVIKVSDVRVRDIMIPRSQIVTIDISQPAEAFLPIVLESGHSRFPVVSEDKDHVEGILLAKDLLAYGFSQTETPLSLRSVLRPAVIVPESKRVDVLLNEFRADRYHMSIVVDEYGGVSGLVTIEDILELIVGEIEDETDDQETDEIRRLNKRVFNVQALTEIDTFNEYFGAEFSDDEFDTLGGMIMHAFGHMPTRGESVEIDGFLFKVLSADKRRVSQLQVKIPNQLANKVQEPS